MQARMSEASRVLLCLVPTLLVGVILFHKGAQRPNLDLQKAWFEHTKATLHTMTPAQAADHFKTMPMRTAPPPHQNKIDHFVVVFMENHAADSMLGCMDLPGFDGVRGGHAIPKDPNEPSKGKVNVTCGTQPYVCRGGPGYDPFKGKLSPSGDPGKYPYGDQSDSHSYAHGADGNAISMFSEEQLPVKAAAAHEFGVFNKYFASVPSMSTPNHFFSQSGTSCGIHDNILYSQCGGKQDTFPMFTIYDSLALSGYEFAFYMNASCGLPGHRECRGLDPHTGEAGSPVSSPDVAMAGVGRWKTKFKSQVRFYQEAAAGTLPSFVWFDPRAEGGDHPCNDVAKGERTLKDVYEALRAGPKWNRTLLLVVYDDPGGFYDHVVPPADVPADDAACHLSDHCQGSAPFDFRRLGLRVASLLISPWIPKGVVFQEPAKGGQFEHSSIPATAKTLFNLTGYLTKRDAWAGSFEELLSLDVPRSDCPLHFPAAPANATPWGDWEADDPPPGQLLPQHCSSGQRRPPGAPFQAAACQDFSSITQKQRNRIALMARLTNVPEPSITTKKDAERWLSHNWDTYMLQEF